MKRICRTAIATLLAGLGQCIPAVGQDKPSAEDSAREAKAAKPSQAKKVYTNDDLPGQEHCAALAQTPKGNAKEDPVVSAFLQRIAGRWNFAHVRKGNESWWPDHGSSKPKNEVHYLFGPRALLIESRPEFGLPSITSCFVYGSGRKVSEELFDLELHKPSEPAPGEVKRFKLSADKKTLEMATDAEGNPQPTIQVLEFVGASWSPGIDRP
jgi:hypothetical protein